MNRGACFAFVTLLAAGPAGTAVAQTPVERGAYLVNTIMTCNNCHTPMGPNGPQFDKALSGGLRFNEPPFDVTASNLTPDPETGLGKWSDADFKKALLEGVRPAGHHLAEVMPTGFYKILTPGDLDAIIAYLRSLPPVANKVRDPVYKMDIPHKVFPGAEKPMSQADLNDKLKRGFYLVTIGHCMECHTPFGAPGRGPTFENSLGKGGRDFPRSLGHVDVAQHHIEQVQGHRRLERRRHQARHHPGCAQGRHPAQAADGVSRLRQDDRCRPRCRGRLSAHGAGEGVMRVAAPTSSAPARILAHHIVDIGRGEIVGDDVAAGCLRPRLIHAPRQYPGQGKAKAVALLRRRRPRLQRLLGERRGGGDRNHLARAGRIEVECGKDLAERFHRRSVQLAAVMHVEGGRAARRQPLLDQAYRTPRVSRWNGT